MGGELVWRNLENLENLENTSVFRRSNLGCPENLENHTFHIFIKWLLLVALGMEMMKIFRGFTYSKVKEIFIVKFWGICRGH